MCVCVWERERKRPREDVFCFFHFHHFFCYYAAVCHLYTCPFLVMLMVLVSETATPSLAWCLGNTPWRLHTPSGRSTRSVLDFCSCHLTRSCPIPPDFNPLPFPAPPFPHHLILHEHYHWCELPQVSFLSRRNMFFVVTKVCLLRWKVLSP